MSEYLLPWTIVLLALLAIAAITFNSDEYVPEPKAHIGITK